MDLHDATGATGSMSVVRSAGVVSCVSLGHLEKEILVLFEGICLQSYIDLLMRTFTGKCLFSLLPSK